MTRRPNIPTEPLGRLTEDLLDRTLTRLRVVIVAGSIQAGHRILDELQDTLNRPPDPVTRETYLAATWSGNNRTLGYLERAGIETVGDLLDCSPEDLLAISGMGPHQVAEVSAARERFMGMEETE